jgi:hypothetical protein
VNATLLKFTKVARKTRARNEGPPPRKPLQRAKIEDVDPAQIPGGNNDNISAVKPCARHRFPCQKKLSEVFPSSNKRKRPLEEGDNLKSDSAQLPASTHAHPQQLLVGREIIVQDHNCTATSQPRTDHYQSPTFHHSASQGRQAWDTQHHGVALVENPERFTSNPTSHGETLDDPNS